MAYVHLISCCAADGMVFLSRWLEESLRLLEIPSEQCQVLLNDFLGFSKIPGIYFSGKK